MDDGLPTDARAAVVEVGERLAARSPLLAQAFAQHAVAAWRAFGPRGFARWAGLGEELATRGASSSEGAVAFFALAPRAFGAGALDSAAAW